VPDQIARTLMDGAGIKTVRYQLVLNVLICQAIFRFLSPMPMAVDNKAHLDPVQWKLMRLEYFFTLISTTEIL
jgi:hypothetical protein